jgi:hypothetical protein
MLVAWAEIAFFRQHGFLRALRRMVVRPAAADRGYHGLPSKHILADFIHSFCRHKNTPKTPEETPLPLSPPHLPP